MWIKILTIYFKVIESWILSKSSIKDTTNYSFVIELKFSFLKIIPNKAYTSPTLFSIFV